MTNGNRNKVTNKQPSRERGRKGRNQCNSVDYEEWKKVIDEQRSRFKQICWRNVVQALGCSSTDVAKLSWIRTRDRHRKRCLAKAQQHRQEEKRLLAVPMEANFTPATLEDLDVLFPLFPLYDTYAAWIFVDLA